MEKRLILVFVFTFIAIFLSQQFLFKKTPQESAGQKPAQEQQQQQAQTPSAPVTAQAAPAPTAPAAASKAATAETETVVENNLYKITFTNKGAQVKSWILKNYKDERGNPLELVHQQAASQYGYPLSLWSWDESLRNKLNSGLYITSATGVQAVPGTLSFEFSDGDVTVTKKLTFSDNSYVVDVETAVQRGGQYISALPAWPAGFGDATVPSSYSGQRIETFNGKDVDRLSIDKKGAKISGGRVVQGAYEWVGAVDQYFAAIFLPDDPRQVAVAQLRNAIQVPKDLNKPDPNNTVKAEVIGTAVGRLNAPSRSRLFVGPKAMGVLDSVHAKSVNGGQGSDLRAVVDFGMFSFIARPLFAWLRWTHDHWVSNWGWSIIILTIIINIALLPLRVISMRSALKMQKIAPQIQSINDKYKKYSMRDPRRAEANQEIAALYKQHNVNPASGCLPILIQMPFLFAFYAMLAATIELRHAQWFWLKDLSTPDKWFIIPVAIIISTVYMQRMTPQAGMAPEQQRMMNFMMPVMLGLMSWSVASGLGVYWVTGTLVSIVQQWAMNRTELGREIRAEAEKRARKQALKK